MKRVSQKTDQQGPRYIYIKFVVEVEVIRFVVVSGGAGLFGNQGLQSRMTMC